MNQDNISNVPEITFSNKQIVSREIGSGIPVSEASYIAAPNSIKIAEEEGEISGTVQKYSWTPLSTYLSKIKKDIDNINNSLIGTLPPTSAEEETSISNTVGINVITNIGVNGNSISYTYTPIKVDFTEINDTIQSIINYIDPPLRLLAIPSEITFSGENYATGVNAYVETNINNTSLVKWESTGTENVKLNTYFGLNNIITPISYKNTSPDDKIKISINTTYFNGDPKTAETEIPLKYNKTYGGLINISYTVYNEYIYK